MGHKTPRVLITTSSNPSEQSRIFAKVLRHVLPNSFSINRGNHSRSDIHKKAMNELCDLVYIIFSKENRVDKLVIFRVYSDKILQEGLILKINQYIDHQIYGFHKLPESGPLSTSLETRAINNELLDYFQQYWGVKFGTKTSLWLILDNTEHKRTSFISFIDALTQRKFFYAEVQLISGENHE